MRGCFVLTVYTSCIYQRFYDERYFCLFVTGNFAAVLISHSDKREYMIAKDWRERRGTPVEYADVSRTKGDSNWQLSWRL